MSSAAEPRPSWRPSAYLLLLQGAFYFLTGVWPIVHIDSFLMVTGPKTDLWLVQTVGVLIAVMGATMLAGAFRRRAVAEIIFLASGAALALIAVDVVFVVRRAIGPIYLLDAAVETGLVVAWIVILIIEARTRWKQTATCL